MRARRRLFVLGAALGLSSLAFACSALLDLQPPPIDAADTGPSADTSDENPVIDPGCPIRYVSTARGNDGNDGCTKDHAFKTITGAVAAVNAAKAQGYDIRVTGGSYTEDVITITLPGALSGGWDETFTTQISAEATGATILRPAAPSSQAKVTMVVTPRVASGTPMTTHLSGLQIHGPNVPTLDATAGLRVTGTTAPIQINGCELVGGDATNSRALSILGGTPDVYSNTITSGTAAGAAAVELNNGTPAPTAHLHGNTISGGLAAKQADVQVDSLAVILANVIATAATSNPFENNTIHIESGSGPTSAPPAMTGIQVSNATVDIIANTITSAGGSLEGESTSGIIGVNLVTGATARLAGNHIASGGGGGANNGDFYSIKAIGATSVVIENNMIFAGEAAAGTGAGTVTGIYLNAVGSALVADNSIYTGYPVGQAKPAFGIYIGPTQTTGVVIQGNIIAAAGVLDWGVKGNHCPGTIASLENNLFVGQQLGVFNIAECGIDGGTTPKDIASIAPFVMTSSGNRILKASLEECSSADQASGACIAFSDCTPAQSCTDVLFGFSTTSATDAFDGGWQLAPDVPCDIGNGGIDTKPSLTRDYYGVPRPNSVGFAIGAAQLVDDAGRCKP